MVDWIVRETFDSSFSLFPFLMDNKALSIAYLTFGLDR